MKKIIDTPNAPAPIGPYSQAVLFNNMLFASGQIAIDPITGNLVDKSIEEETHQVMKNLQTALALADCTLDDVCKTTCWLQDARDFGSFNRIYMSYFKAGKPARSTTEARLMVDARVEVDVVAYKPKG